MQRYPKKMEDFYRYYSKTNDWAVNFTNNKALPPEQIKQYFSKWGTINNVRQTGTTGTGYCFVHFESEESARDCSIGMKNEFCVRLRPFVDRPRHVPIDMTNEDVGLHGEELDFSFRKIEKVKDTRECINDLRDDGQKIDRDSLISNPSQTDLNSSETSGNSQESPKCVEEINRDSNSSTWRSVKNGNPIGTLRKPLLSSPGGSNISGSLIAAGKQKDLNSSAVNGHLESFKENRETSSHSSNDEKILKYSGVVPVVIQEMPQVISKGIPELIEASRVLGDPTFLSSAVNYLENVEAEDVVVGNIPEVWDINHLLKLFQRYEPICATDIRVNRENCIRYCHVYFQNRMDAQAVECLYDNCEVYGKKLIVMRAENLSNEAARY